jgi:hypothetical protein
MMFLKYMFYSNLFNLFLINKILIIFDDFNNINQRVLVVFYVLAAGAPPILTPYPPNGTYPPLYLLSLVGSLLYY